MFLLSLRLRKGEIQTLHKIGGSRPRVAAILASEIVTIVATSAVLAAGLTLLTSRFGGEIVKAFLLSNG